MYDDDDDLVALTSPPQQLIAIIIISSGTQVCQVYLVTFGANLHNISIAEIFRGWFLGNLLGKIRPLIIVPSDHSAHHLPGLLIIEHVTLVYWQNTFATVGHIPICKNMVTKIWQIQRKFHWPLG